MGPALGWRTPKPSNYGQKSISPLTRQNILCPLRHQTKYTCLNRLHLGTHNGEWTLKAFSMMAGKDNLDQSNRHQIAKCLNQDYAVHIRSCDLILPIDLCPILGESATTGQVH